MAKKGVSAAIPKLEGFARVSYQSPAFSGLTARVYSAFFGEPRKIIDAYNILYCRGMQRTPSTGRISLSTSALIEAGYLDRYKIETSNWPLFSSNLLPLYEFFERRQVRLNDADRETLEAALIPDGDAAARFGISQEEAQGKEEFIPSPLKLTAHLNSALTHALLTLCKQQQPQFEAERKLLERIKKRAYGVSEKEREEGRLEKPDLRSLEAFSDDLVLKTRSSMKEGEEPRNILLFKLLRLLHAKDNAQIIEELFLSVLEQ